MIQNVDIKPADSYIREALNKRILNLSRCVKGTYAYVSKNASAYKREELQLTKIDSKITQSINRSLAGKQNIEKYSRIGPYQEILRTYRDLLFDSATREQRLFAGIRQTLRKGKTNKDVDRTFL